MSNRHLDAAAAVLDGAAALLARNDEHHEGWILTMDRVDEALREATEGDVGVALTGVNTLDDLRDYLIEHPELQDALIEGSVRLERPVSLPTDVVVDAESLPNGEVRHRSATGGEKGAKPTEIARLPVDALKVVAEHFFDGSRKYADPAPGVSNWSLGYPWSLSLNALQRHLADWAKGDSVDPEFDRSHLAAVAFHALVLLQFEIMGWGTDDRYTPDARQAYLDSQKEL